MAYRPNMGFIPETLENLIERLRISAQDKLGYTSNTNEEFMASNLWLVYYAVALMKNQTDILFEELLDKVFDYFLETYGSLKQDEGSSTNGLNKIFSNHTKGFEIQTFHNNGDLDLGELRVCLLKPDLPTLKTKLEDYFDFTIKTNVGNPLPTKKLSCDVGFNVDFHYTLAKETPLYLAISYYFMSEYVPTGKEKEIILAEFLNKWDKFQTLGKDFLPDVYLGNNESLPFLASISVGYRTHLEDTFLFEPKIHEFGEYFTIKTSDDGEHLIELLEQEL